MVILIIGAQCVDGSRTNAYCQVPPEDGGWRDYRGTLTVPAGKALSRILVWPTIECEPGKAHAASETAWFDDLVVRVTPVGSGEPKPGP